MPDIKPKGLDYLHPKEIGPNPENPRLVFVEKSMQELLESINEIGILVPLIVFYDDDINKYVLLDGERRWRCAGKLQLEKVPVNIISKPTRLQNILEMFNIHNVRIEWGPMEVAWKLKVIIKELGYDKESELARLTSLSLSEIRKSRKLLSFDKKYQDMVHDGPGRGGIKEDFLIELNPTLNWLENNLSFTKDHKNQLIDTLIKKHKRMLIQNYVRDFRNLSKILRSDLPKTKVKTIVKNLILNSNYSIDDAYEISIRYSISTKDLENKANKLIGHLREFEIIWEKDESKELLEVLKELKEVIGDILRRQK